jgi:hypothetical protein
MKCRDTDRLVTAYVDGELDERRSSALRGHTRVCPRCADRVEDEMRVRDAAADLEPSEPPAELWQAIDARLAQAEIGDARRSRLSLWWQRVVDGTRRRALPLGLVGSAAAAAALAIWLTRSESDQHRSATSGPPGSDSASGSESGSAPGSGSGSGPESGAASDLGACPGAASHDELLLCQIAEADRRYLGAIDELTSLVVEERDSWTVEQAARFDAVLAELDRAASDELRRLALAQSAAPADRDPLYAIYRAKIDLLSEAAVAPPPGGEQ